MSKFKQYVEANDLTSDPMGNIEQYVTGLTHKLMLIRPEELDRQGEHARLLEKLGKLHQEIDLFLVRIKQLEQQWKILQAIKKNGISTPDVSINYKN